jgi:hypothetical protein
MTDLVKQGNSLIGYYISQYEKKNFARPLINKNTAKWAARDIIESFGLEECKQAVDWYFHVKDSSHDWNWYTNNVEKLIAARRDKERDDIIRRENRIRARAWLNE